MTVAHHLAAAFRDHRLQPFPDLLPADARRDAAVLLPLRLEPEPTITVVVRASHLADHAGEAGFPGGKPEAGDADLADTAIREAHEELGLRPSDVRLLGPLSAVPVGTSRYRLNPFVALVDHPGAWRPSGELARAIDAPLAALCDGQVPYRAVPVEWAGQDLLSPFFVFDDAAVLFGASAHALVELMDVAGPALGLELPPPELRDNLPRPWTSERSRIVRS